MKNMWLPVWLLVFSFATLFLLWNTQFHFNDAEAKEAANQAQMIESGEVAWRLVNTMNYARDERSGLCYSVRNFQSGYSPFAIVLEVNCAKVEKLLVPVPAGQ